MLESPLQTQQQWHEEALLPLCHLHYCWWGHTERTKHVVQIENTAVPHLNHTSRSGKSPEYTMRIHS